MIDVSRATPVSRFARFFLANLLGVSIDMAIAVTLIRVAGLSTTTAAALSIAAAAVVMYFVHEFWTFAGSNGGFSSKRLVAVVASAFVGMATRAAVITGLRHLPVLPIEGLYVQYAHLFIAVACSFLVNFFLVKAIIERRSGAAPARNT